jgi:hypothetical protein
VLTTGICFARYRFLRHDLPETTLAPAAKFVANRPVRPMLGQATPSAIERHEHGPARPSCRGAASAGRSAALIKFFLASVRLEKSSPSASQFAPAMSHRNCQPRAPRWQPKISAPDRDAHPSISSARDPAPRLRHRVQYTTGQFRQLPRNLSMDSNFFQCTFSPNFHEGIVHVTVPAQLSSQPPVICVSNSHFVRTLLNTSVRIL